MKVTSSTTFKPFAITIHIEHSEDLDVFKQWAADRKAIAEEWRARGRERKTQYPRVTQVLDDIATNVLER